MNQDLLKVLMAQVLLFLLNTGSKKVYSKNRLLTTIGYRINGKTTYALEGSIFIAGAGVQWLRDKIKFIKKLLIQKK